MRGLASLSFLCYLAMALATTAAVQAKTRDAESQMIVADNPIAAEAGRNILRAGGTATDAAIAALLVLGLVEPQTAGIGGGAFLLHYSAKSKRVDAYDGRETAPAGVNSHLFLDDGDQPLDYWQAAVGGRAVGVPGFLRLAKLAHRDHGRLPWAALFAPAISLAEQGFPVSSSLHRLIADDGFLRNRRATASYFYQRDDRPLASGALLHNQAYADTLRQVSVAGPSAFYSGAIAQRIVSAIRNDSENPGFMALRDLENYRAKRRLVLCIPYRHWRICGLPPPTSGGLGVLQVMAILAHFDLASLPANDPLALHLMTEASRLAAADRAVLLADPDAVEVPMQRLLDPTYLQSRAALISPEGHNDDVQAGLAADKFAAMPAQADQSTATLLSVVDHWGNTVAVTASLESAFGSRLMVDGFLLNNQLTQFSFVASVDGLPVANRVSGGKRPRASVAPTMVLDSQGHLVLTIGSPGGPRAVDHVVQALVSALDWGLGLDDVLELPHVASRYTVTELESGEGLSDEAAALRQRGHTTEFVAMPSALSAIQRADDRLIGATDPRGDGMILVD